MSSCEDGTVSCWGDNARGQLGVVAGSESLTPVAATGVTAAVGLAARGEHTCVLHDGGTLSCFGMNFFGQLGDRTTADRRTAAPVIGLP